MTKEEIIEMARKCGWDNPATNMVPLYEFAKLVAEKEREEVAQEIEKFKGFGEDTIASFTVYIRSMKK